FETLFSLFFFNDTATTEIYTLSLHDALPILANRRGHLWAWARRGGAGCRPRSEEHTSELQSHLNLVCRLLLEKKKKKHQHEKNEAELKSIGFAVKTRAHA